MSPVVLLLAIVAAPVVILTILRVQAALVYLSLCLGEVLVIYIGNDANSLVSAVLPHASSSNYAIVKLGLLLLPAVLTTVFMFHSISGGKVILNIFPAASVGVLALILAVPLLSAGTRGSIEPSSVWQHFSQLQTLAVGGSASISLIFLWMQRKGGSEKSKKRRSKS